MMGKVGMKFPKINVLKAVDVVGFLMHFVLRAAVPDLKFDFIKWHTENNAVIRRYITASSDSGQLIAVCWNIEFFLFIL